MLDKIDLLFDDLGWDKSFYSFLRSEKDQTPYSVIKKSEDLMVKMQKDFSNNLATRRKSEENVPEIPQLNLFGR